MADLIDLLDPVDVVVVGNAGLDTEVFLGTDDIDLTPDSSFSHNLDVVGQAGAYCSRGFARLGRHTRFFGSLGDDPAGEQVRRELAADGVRLDCVFPDPAGTARSVNLMTSDGRRRAFYDGRGHMDLAVPADLAERALADVPLAHVHLPNWARTVLLPSIGTISVDLQDVRDVNDGYRADFIEAADILFASGAHLADPAAAAWDLVNRGTVRATVIGLGSDGVLAVERGEEVRHFPPPPLDLPIVDSNGAGDGLATGFLDAYVLEGADLAAAVLRGQLCARWTCAEPGSGHLIDRERLQELETELAGLVRS